MLWKEYVEKKVSKKQKNWLTGIGIYFLVEIGGTLLLSIGIFVFNAIVFGDEIGFFEAYPWYGFIGPILSILFSIDLIKSKKKFDAQLLTISHLASASLYCRYDPVKWGMVAFMFFGACLACVAWMIVKRMEKDYKKTSGYVAPDRQLKL